VSDLTAKRRDAFESAVAGTFRAMSEETETSVRFTTEAPGLRAGELRLPALQTDSTMDDVARIRGEADAAAMKLKFHDPQIHARLAPKSPVSRKIFDAVEQARTEAYGTQLYPGIATNLQPVIEARCVAAGLDKPAAGDAPPLAELVSLLVREAMTGVPAPDSILPRLTAERSWLDDKLASHLDAMASCAGDQKAAADIARVMISDLLGDEAGDDLDSEDEAQDDSDQSDASGDTPPEGSRGQEEDTGEAGGSESGEQSDTEDQDMGDTDGETTVEPTDDMDAEPGDGEQRGSVPWRPNRPFDDVPDAPFYKVFSEAFDEVIKAEDLCDQEELDRLRKYLDQQMVQLSGAVSKLANRLQRRLMAQQRRHWKFDLEEGMLDAARLARVVANPTQPLSYKMESDTEFRDTVVTLLLDNSGSMRGRPISIAAISADILARTLERCGVSVEILGFTTRAWKGGQSRESWLDAGRPMGPGRLNDLLHIIYKTADAPWRRARRNLGLMMREGMLKENIDGEALIWAHNRLLGRPEERRILMVISDGAPVDDSTLSANNGTYLENHLRQVITWIEDKSPVELVAIGIGHDVTRYYKRAVTILDAEQLGGAMTDQLASLFDQAPPSPPRSSASGGRTGGRSSGGRAAIRRQA